MNSYQTALRILDDAPFGTRNQAIIAEALENCFGFFVAQAALAGKPLPNRQTIAVRVMSDIIDLILDGTANAIIQDRNKVRKSA